MAFSIDTRTLQPGDVFIPVKGPNFDGHDFIQDALDKGASKILPVELDAFAKKYRRKLKADVIAIVGSYGKTTVKDMLKAVLSTKFKVEATKENNNNEIGVPLTILQADETTEILLVECGLRQPGDLQVLSKILRPDKVIMTGVGYSHMEFFKTQNALARAKAQIFQSPLSWEGERAAYINAASDAYDVLHKRAESKGYKIWPYTGATGLDQNLAIVEQIAKQHGLTDEDIQEGLRNFDSSAHRLKLYKKSGVTCIDDSYNANPHGMRYALQYMQQFPGRKIAVLGSMLELGKFSEQAHKQLIEDLIQSEVSVLLSIGDEMKGLESEYLDIHHFKSHAELIDVLTMELKSKDVVLVKGSRSLNMDKIVQWFQEGYH